MNKDTPEDILEQWTGKRRSEPTPVASRHFADRTMSSIAGRTQSPFRRFRNGFLKIAAVFVAGAVGFVRIEIVLQFILHAL